MPQIVFGSAAQGTEILSRRDDYVRALGEAERQVHLRSAGPVSEAQYLRHQSRLVRAWSERDQRVMNDAVERFIRFIAPFRVQWPDQLLLVRADRRLEDGASFTRANAAFLSDQALSNPGAAHYFLAHEAFHILSRHDPALREKLYAAIGFHRCGKAEIPERVARLRITNPDAVENLHTIKVRYQGEALEALPFVRFRTDPDPQGGLFRQLENRWLLVDRIGTECRVRESADGVPDVDPRDLEGLFEQIGRNSDYLFGPEEILADNFAILFLAWVEGGNAGGNAAGGNAAGGNPPLPSPDVLDKVRRILLGG